ncbi:MAG TPA: hypothetical protein VIX17_02515 [Pyrinomonadaceae bacterium]|jgi:hypothetical protein
MKDTLNNSTCDRQDDLISFLYGEADANDFKQHLQVCKSCQNEFDSLGGVRESIALWKTEAFSAARAEIAPVPVRGRSAVAALREFFALSPLWMKGAVGFAAVVFCAMAILLVNRTNPAPPPVSIASGAKYTEQEMQAAVARALDDQTKKLAASTAANNPQEVRPASAPIKNRQVKPANRAAEWASHKPLSRSERQQLASDLRLLSSREEDTLNLIGDRINQEF